MAEALAGSARQVELPPSKSFHKVSAARDRELDHGTSVMEVGATSTDEGIDKSSHQSPEKRPNKPSRVCRRESAFISLV